MANHESTAVNDLLDLMANKPLSRASEGDVLFGASVAPIPDVARARPARGTPHGMPAQAPPVMRAPPILIEGMRRSSGSITQIRTRPEDPSEVTLPVVRPAALELRKLVVPVLAFVVAGIFVGGFIAFSGEGGARPHAVATAAVVPASVPAPAVALVEVLVESRPAGATVMMIDHGTTTTLGTTPIRVSVEPHDVDIVFTLDKHATRVEHVDPSANHHVAIALEETPAIEEVVAPAPAPPPPPHRRVASAPVSSHNGVLMISTKPPCAIVVDGHATGLTTPQRSIPLSAGRHQITLINKEQKIKRTIEVQITSDQATKLTRDLMKS